MELADRNVPVGAPCFHTKSPPASIGISNESASSSFSLLRAVCTLEQSIWNLDSRLDGKSGGLVETAELDACEKEHRSLNNLVAHLGEAVMRHAKNKM